MNLFSGLRDDLQGALAEREVEIESPSFSYRGWQIPCSQEMERLGVTYPIGPNIPDESMPLLVRKNAAAYLSPSLRTSDDAVDTSDENRLTRTSDADLIPPQIGHLIRYQQKDWQIDRVDSDATGAFWILTCVSPDT